MFSRSFIFLSVYALLLTALAAQTTPAAPPPKAQQQIYMTPAPPEMDPTKEADIRRLMAVTKADSFITQLMQNLGEGIRPVMSSSLPAGDYRDKLIDLFIAKFKSNIDSKELINMAVPLYDKYFSDQEIKELIKFYETPVGQKAISTLPQLTMEMQKQGRAWGERVGRQSMQQVLDEHPDLKEALEAASVKGKMSQP